MLKGFRILLGIVIVAAFIAMNYGQISGSIDMAKSAFTTGLDSAEVGEALRRGSSRQLRSNRIGGQRYRVTEVIDGDTYEVSGGPTGNGTVRVRLIGIDTPETHGGSKLAEQAQMWNVSKGTVQRWGRQASQTARRLIRGRDVFLELDPAYADEDHRGRHGRLLAYVWVAGEDGTPGYMLNEEILKWGLARATDYGDYVYEPRFQAIEKNLRRSGQYPWAAARQGAAPGHSLEATGVPEATRSMEARGTGGSASSDAAR